MYNLLLKFYFNLDSFKMLILVWLRRFKSLLFQQIMKILWKISLLHLLYLFFIYELKIEMFKLRGSLYTF